jgi:hypothetical protein
MTFLRDSYKPFGITVAEVGENSRFYSARVIAIALGVYSRSGRPHAHAVSAIIDKLDLDIGGHIEIAPYGLVGFSVRYDAVIIEAVEEWLINHGKPRNIPYNNFAYHVHYAYYGGDDDEAIDFDDDDEAINFDVCNYFIPSNEMCDKSNVCGACPNLSECIGKYLK